MPNAAATRHNTAFAHQAIGKQAPLELLYFPGQEVQEQASVNVVAVDFPTAVAARHDAVCRTRERDAQRPGHGDSLHSMHSADGLRAPQIGRCWAPLQNPAIGPTATNFDEACSG